MGSRTTVERLLKGALLTPVILARFGTLRPNKGRLPGCDHWIYFDPADGRGRKKLIVDALRGRVGPPCVFWREFNRHLRPDAALDVGVNYGECLFGDVYDPRTLAVGVEANPDITALLELTRANHPNQTQIHIFNYLVCSQNAENVALFVDPSHSGTGSACKDLHAESKNLISHVVPGRTLDDILSSLRPAAKERLLFKIDIEGYEAHALAGAANTLREFKTAVGLIEFDSTFLDAAGTPPREFFETLSESFAVYEFSARERRLIGLSSYDDISLSRYENGRVHTDLALVKADVPECNWVPPGWTIA